MPGVLKQENPSKKRKGVEGAEKADRVLKKSRKAVANQYAAHIAEVEEAICDPDAPKYNDIATILLPAARKELEGKLDRTQAIVALCAVFCRLFTDGKLSKSNAKSEEQLQVIGWLRAQYEDYRELLLAILSHGSGDLQAQILALSLCMLLVQAEVSYASTSAVSAWKTGLFFKTIEAVLSSPSIRISQQLVERYLQQYDDLRHYALMAIAQLLNSVAADCDWMATLRTNALEIMSTLDVVENTTTKLDSLFCEREEKSKSIQVTAHRKQAQQAWLALVSSGLEKDQRKKILGMMTSKIVPWLQNVELLMDFLTDSYNEGGATSLLALSGLFYLISEKNLDYPEFYTKLYSLLDVNLLHSKHRSRFFRLMNTFMSSTHLPAAMVASFIKRLSRLALAGPPAGIVAAIPWIYNMLKAHPACTFMMHREPRTNEERERIEDTGATDPFKMEEVDPLESNAIESCLWELVTLQDHYHPNVASLAKIISEQFTKRSYNVEDFLDHSYSSVSTSLPFACH